MECLKRLTPSQAIGDAYPFKNHAPFPFLIDILSRKDQHHVYLVTDFSLRIQPAFLKALQLALTNDDVPTALRHAEVFYLDSAALNDESSSIEKDLNHLWQQLLENQNHYLLLAMPASIFSHPAYQKMCEAFSSHPKCRLLLLTQTASTKNDYLSQYITVNIPKPNDADIFTLLKQQRVDLENFHNVLIPDDLLKFAFALSERYLKANQAFDNTLLLIDSSAARASISSDTLTKEVLIDVLSTWTQIPASHLTLSAFNLHEFTHHMQQELFGQEAAITILSQKLQQPFSYLEQAATPICTFLFAGPEHSGKKTAAHALTEQLFRQLNVLYYAKLPSSSRHNFADIKLQRSLEHYYTPLKEVIRETPHAVIMFEYIDQASPVVLDGLLEIFNTGYLHDSDGQSYNFRQSIIILSTTLGSERLTEIAKQNTKSDDADLNLMQLVMIDPKQEKHSQEHFLPQDIAQALIPDITSKLPPALCQHLCIVPFLPLTHTIVEKIIRLKLKTLGKEIHARYGMELGYAPEVIRFLAKDTRVSIKKILQPLYFAVEQAILNYGNHHEPANHLFLQLNDTGQYLRCDYLMMREVSG